MPKSYFNIIYIFQLPKLKTYYKNMLVEDCHNAYSHSANETFIVKNDSERS